MVDETVPYCRTCGGQRTGRIEYDENDEVVEWLRYEMDGLNHLRIDEVYDADSNGELEDPAATGDAWRVQRVYINGPGQIGQIAKVIVFTYASGTSNTVASEEVYYYHYDILGNVSVISDPAGDEADQFEQDAFGNLVSGSWSGRVGGITEQITTKPYDADLGLYYFNARWYDPQVGAFVSRDPQLSSHIYGFCYSSPVSYVDPTGERGFYMPPLPHKKYKCTFNEIQREYWNLFSAARYEVHLQNLENRRLWGIYIALRHERGAHVDVPLPEGFLWRCEQWAGEVVEKGVSKALRNENCCWTYMGMFGRSKWWGIHTPFTHAWTTLRPLERRESKLSSRYPPARHYTEWLGRWMHDRNVVFDAWPGTFVKRVAIRPPQGTLKVKTMGHMKRKYYDISLTPSNEGPPK